MASLLLSACVTAQGTAPGKRAPEHPAPASVSTPRARAEASPPREPETVAAAAERPPAAPFPPPDFAPPFEKSAADGDGRWAPFGRRETRDRAATDPPVLVRTVVHPHPASRFMTVTIVAMDLERIHLHLAPGTSDVEWAKVRPSRAPGLVPPEHRSGVLAVMNGGFQPKHGRWGLVASGVTIAPPRDQGCTIAVFRDGSVEIGAWESLAVRAPEMESLRQTPPCLVSGGAVHPLLLAGKDKAWAGHVKDLTTRRRSAIGLHAGGRALLYALGEEAEPRVLAEGLRAAGAVVAAELDINWYWTRFLLIGDTDAGPRVTTPLVPKMEHGESEYIERASSRDFFYLTLRDPASSPRKW